MAYLRILVCCSLLAAATCMPDRTERAKFCLNLLKDQSKEETTAALLSCVKVIKESAAREGRDFKLTGPGVYIQIGQCIATRVGVIDQSGRVNKAELERRVRASSKISEEQRTAYLAKLATCDTWDGCLKNECRLQ